MNENNKFTPGPWKAERSNAADIDIMSEAGEFIATVHCEGRQAEAPGNSALCAAAPELLAALEKIAEGHVMAGREFSALECIHEYQKIARAAIRKAMGE